MTWQHDRRGRTSALFLDLYQLKMAQAYRAEAMNGPADFELLVRSMPERRGLLVAAGLGELLDDLEAFRFTVEDQDYLQSLQILDPKFIEDLGMFRFEGDIDAVPEGTLVFPGTPLLRISAPIVQAQIVETLVINRVHFATLVASKAARVVRAAGGRPVVDFGSRRAAGIDAALQVARSGYLVGLDGTALVEAGQRYGIPVVGTMAHSYIQAHRTEDDAFLRFAEQFRGTTVLVDTFDAIEAVRSIIRLHRETGGRFAIGSIRLDSGDLSELSMRSRSLLDEAGLNEVRIIASGGLDEYQVANLVAADAPIDGFGVGTALAVVDDVPSLDMAYKLVMYDGIPRMKLSASKAHRPWPKQVHRRFDSNGRMIGDLLTTADAPAPPNTQPLLRPVMRKGRRLDDGQVTLEAARRYALDQADRLPKALQGLEPPATPYLVEIGEPLKDLTERTRRSLASSSRRRDGSDRV